MKFLKQVLRIGISVPLCIIGYRFFEFGTFGNMMLFMAVYLLISIILEVIFKQFENKNRKTK